MQNYGHASISDLLGDFVAYRNLRPADTRLPGLADLTSGPAPRKGEPAYARIVAAILDAARRIAAPETKLRRVLLIGDTRRSDAGCFNGIVAETGWVGRCFICDEVAGAAPLIRREDARQFAMGTGGNTATGQSAESELGALRAALSDLRGAVGSARDEASRLDLIVARAESIAAEHVPPFIAARAQLIARLGLVWPQSLSHR